MSLSTSWPTGKQQGGPSYPPVHIQNYVSIGYIPGAPHGVSPHTHSSHQKPNWKSISYESLPEGYQTPQND